MPPHKPPFPFTLLVLLVLAIASACATDQDSLPAGPDDGRKSGVAVHSRAAFMRAVGCRAGSDTFIPGTIGLFRSNGSVERFNCRGVSGAKIREGVRRYQEQEFALEGLSFALGGYWIRHFSHAIRWCAGVKYSLYLGGVLQSVDIDPDGNGCEWRWYFWDEWVPVDDSDEMPESPGGGGGFFSPEDSLGRLPTIDTAQKRNHKTCDGVDPVGWRANMNCLKPLTARDSAWVFDSVNAFLKNPSTIADTADRRMCTEMRAWLDSARSAHFDLMEQTEGVATIFYRGSNDTYQSGKQPHLGQSEAVRRAGEGIIRKAHFDPRMLDSLLPLPGGPSKFAETLLHEVLHIAGGKDHPEILPSGYLDIPYFETLEEKKACTL